MQTTARKLLLKGINPICTCSTYRLSALYSYSIGCWLRIKLREAINSEHCIQINSKNQQLLLLFVSLLFLGRHRCHRYTKSMHRVWMWSTLYRTAHSEHSAKSIKISIAYLRKQNFVVLEICRTQKPSIKFTKMSMFLSFFTNSLPFHFLTIRNQISFLLMNIF